MHSEMLISVQAVADAGTVRLPPSPTDTGLTVCPQFVTTALELLLNVLSCCFQLEAS